MLQKHLARFRPVLLISLVAVISFVLVGAHNSKAQVQLRNVQIGTHTRTTPGPNATMKSVDPIVMPVAKASRGKSTVASAKPVTASVFTCARIALNPGQTCVDFQFGWGTFDSSDPAPGNRVMLVRTLNQSTQTLSEGLDFYNSAGENIRMSILIANSDDPDSGFGIGPDPLSPNFAVQFRLASMNGVAFTGFVIFTYPTAQQAQIATWIHPRLLGDTTNKQVSPFISAKPVSFVSASSPVFSKQGPGEVRYPWPTTDAGRMQITVNHSGSQSSSLHVIATVDQFPIHGGDFTVPINPGSNIINLEDYIATRLDPGSLISVRLLGNDAMMLCQTFPQTALVQINVPLAVVVLPPTARAVLRPTTGTRPPVIKVVPRAPK